MSLYNYLYYHYYLLFYKWRKDDIPEWNAVFALSIFLIANIFILAFLLGHRPGNNFDPKIVGGIFGFLIILLNYIIYIRNDNYKLVAKRFNQRTKTEEKAGIAIVILCTIEGFLLPFIFAYTHGFGLY
ncbi:hypothetical protein C8E01_106291 [Pontibacter virosus]|uniref:Uncharacterized protein n=1 Tax=Pontibacter virosus TaxID=1765052 RepID=A0A2U1AX00_9BACT|nr:hypothetical protein C8E01_106291 [Pontibacter virosus]